MNYSEINKIISSKLKRNELAEFFRNEIDEISVLGNPVALSSSLLAFEIFSDFNFDGFKIIRNCDISDIITCDKNESLNFVNNICHKEKLFSDSANNLDIKNWNAVFTYIMNNKIPISVECSFEDAIDYYFGTIIQVRVNLVTMQCFDGSGIMFKDKIKVNLDFVSAVTIGDRYTSYMAKYAVK